MPAYKTSNPYEHKFGYSRAVSRGPFVFLSGTTSIEAKPGSSSHVLYPNDAYRQTLAIFSTFREALEALESSLRDVVRVRMFVKDHADGDEVARATRESLEGHCEWATTMVSLLCLSVMHEVVALMYAEAVKRYLAMNLSSPISS